MSENEQISQTDARVFYQLRNHPVVSELVDMVDEFDCEIEELYDEEIREKDDGTLVVFLRLQETEADHYLVSGTFTEQNDGSYTVDEVWLEKAKIHGPLAGHGTRWMFEDGDLVEREWIS